MINVQMKMISNRGKQGQLVGCLVARAGWLAGCLCLLVPEEILYLTGWLLSDCAGESASVDANAKR